MIASRSFFSLVVGGAALLAPSGCVVCVDPGRPGACACAPPHLSCPPAPPPWPASLCSSCMHICTMQAVPMRPHDAPSRRSQQANQDVLRHHVHRRVKVVAGHAMPGDTSGPIITLWPWPHGNAGNAYRPGCRVGRSAAAHSPVSSHACSRASPLLTHFAHPLCGAAGASGSSCRTLPPGSLLYRSSTQTPLTVARRLSCRDLSRIG